MLLLGCGQRQRYHRQRQRHRRHRRRYHRQRQRHRRHRRRYCWQRQRYCRTTASVVTTTLAPVSPASRPIETWITNRFNDTPGTVRQLCSVKTNLTYVSTLSVVPHHTPIVKVTLLNARSVCNKALQIYEYVCEHKCDIVAITERWLRKTGDDLVIAEVTPPGFVFRLVARSSRRGGDVAILHRDTFATKILPSLHCNTFELLRMQFSAAHSISFIVCVVYHPPASSRSSGTSSEFYTELECLFTEASVSVTPTIIAGDFNIHFDDVTKSEPIHNLLDAFNLLQHIHSPTHKTGQHWTS